MKSIPRYKISEELLRRKNHIYKYQPKQQEFADGIDIWTPGRKMGFYGGAMGGGKTYVCVGLSTELALLYPGSKWTITRKTRERCSETVVPDFKQMAKGLYRDFNDSKLIATFHNGSIIDFKGENIDKDPELDAWKSYATNGVFFEQLEEMQKKTFDMATIRVGRHRIDPMPPQIVMASINPTYKWVKKDVHIKWVNGELEDDRFYIPALIEDNKYLFEDKAYMGATKNLDPITYARYIEGSWDAFAIDKPFMYAFDEKHIVNNIEHKPELTTYFSFDFNVDPITCIVAQHSHTENYIYILDEFRLTDSNTYDLCDRILASPYGKSFKIVTGDASGMARNTMTKGSINNYTIICQKLGLNPDGQLALPGRNPPVDESRTLCNAIFYNHKEIKIHERCQYLIEDLRFVQVNDKGDIDKTQNAHRSHLLDGLRYYLNSFWGNFVSQNI